MEHRISESLRLWHIRVTINSMQSSLRPDLAVRRAVAPMPTWIVHARERQRARSQQTVAAIASRAAAAAEAAISSTEPSTSSHISSLPQQLLRYRSSLQPVENWDYKYQRFPCASPVRPDDMRCLQVEALFQNVLGYPRLPPRVYRFMQTHPDLTVEDVTATVEGLTARYGKELVFYILRRTPFILGHPVEELMEKAEGARRMLDLKPTDVFMYVSRRTRINACRMGCVAGDSTHGLHCSL